MNYKRPEARPDITSDHDDDDEMNPHQVYVYDCCCISREMSPAINHMNSFLNVFFLFNFLVFVLGFACLGMGLWFRIDPKVYEIHKYIETQNFTIAGWIMLFGGFIACLMSLVGFSASMKQSQTLLGFYIAIIFVLTITFIGTLVLLVVHGLGWKLEKFLNKEIYEQIRRRTMSNEIVWLSQGGPAQFLDFVQVKLRCCGAKDFTDYEILGLVVPTTCYTIEKNYINAPGCGHALREMFDIRAGLATGFVSGSILAQLISLIAASLMFCSIYHWRASPKPIVIAETREVEPKVSESRGPSPIGHHYHDNRTTSLRHQRPRSRTPIIM